MATQAVAGQQMPINPILAANPQYLQEVLQLQRRQQMAQALMQQGTSDISYDQKGKISPLQGINKMLAAYLGAKMGNDGIDQQAQLQSQGAQQMRDMFMGNQGAQPTQPVPQGSAQTTPASISPQAIGSAMGATPASSPMVIPGMDPRAALYAYQTDPAGYMKELAASASARSMPTNEQKNSQDPVIGADVRSNLHTQNMGDLQRLQTARALLPDGSRQAQEIDAQITKLNTNMVGRGQLAMAGNRPLAYNPDLPEGQQPTFGTNPAGFTSATGTGNLPGYTLAAGQTEYAKEAAKQGSEVHIGVPTPQGPQNMTGMAATGIGAQYIPNSGKFTPTPAQAALIADDIARTHNQSPSMNIGPQQVAQGNPQVPQSPQIPPAAPQVAPPYRGAPGTFASPGPTPTDLTMNDGAAKKISDIQLSTQQALQNRNTLLNVLEVLKNTKTGPGTASAFHLTGLLNSLGLPVAKDATENYQTISKLLANASASAAAVTGNNRSDQSLEQFMHGQPNADLMAKGPLEAATRYVISQTDAVPAANQFLQSAAAQKKAAGDPNFAANALNDWNNVYDPKVFHFNRMSDTEKAAQKYLMQDQDKKQGTNNYGMFGKKYEAYRQNGWLQ